jgi:hypothetical protein
MNRTKKLALALGLSLVLTGIGAGKVVIQDLVPQSQEARKVNEYEGQHRVAKKGSFDLTEVDGGRVAFSWGASNSGS